MHRVSLVSVEGRLENRLRQLKSHLPLATTNRPCISKGRVKETYVHRDFLMIDFSVIGGIVVLKRLLDCHPLERELTSGRQASQALCQALHLHGFLMPTLGTLNWTLFQT